jgi:hypothetical protein
MPSQPGLSQEIIAQLITTQSTPGKNLACSARAKITLMLHLHRFFAAIALGAAALFFALLTLRDEVHLLPVGFGDSLGYYTFIEPA